MPRSENLIYITWILIPIKEGDDSWNGAPNSALKLGYEYVTDAQVRSFNIEPCSESFDNASAPALQTSDCPLNLRRAMIFGMAGPTDFRNSAMSTSMMVRSDTLICYLALRVLTMHFQLLYYHSSQMNSGTQCL
jgi:hypothetical protein